MYKFLALIVVSVFLICCNKKEEISSQSTIKNNSLSYSYNPNLSGDSKLLYESAKKYVNTDPDKALFYAEQLAEVAKNQGDSKAEMISDYIFGYIYKRKKLYVAALTNFFKSIKLAEEIKDVYKIADCHQIIGNVYFEVGLYEDAITYYGKAVENLEAIGNLKSVGDVYWSIGIAYRELQQYNQAQNYFFKSIFIQKDLSSQVELANSYNSLGNLFKEMEEYDQALNYLNKSLAISQSLSNDRLMSLAIHNIGYIYFKQKNYIQAKEYYAKALEHVSKVTDFPELFIWINRDIGLNELAMNEPNKAISYLEKAQAIAQGNNDSKLLIEITGLLSECYKKIGNDQKSLFYSDKSRNIQTENFKQEFDKLKQQFQQRSEVERFNHSSMLLRKKKDTNFPWVLIVGIVGLVSGAGVTLLGIKRKVKIVETPMIKLRDPNLVDLSWWHKNQLKWIEEEAIESKKLIQGIEAVIKESLDKPTKEVVQVILAQLKEKLKTIRYWSTATNDVDPTPPPKPPKD